MKRGVRATGGEGREGERKEQGRVRGEPKLEEEDKEEGKKEKRRGGKKAKTGNQAMGGGEAMRQRRRANRGGTDPED